MRVGWGLFRSGFATQDEDFWNITLDTFVWGRKVAKLPQFAFMALYFT